jgi:hypothetical protein
MVEGPVVLACDAVSMGSNRQETLTQQHGVTVWNKWIFINLHSIKNYNTFKMSSRYSVLWPLYYIDHTFQGSQLCKYSVSIVNGVVLITRYTRIVYEMHQKEPSRHKIQVLFHTQRWYCSCMSAHIIRTVELSSFGSAGWNPGFRI